MVEVGVDAMPFVPRAAFGDGESRVIVGRDVEPIETSAFLACRQKLAVRILEKYHHRVTVANNGLEALEAIQKKRYDCILMDVQMPVMVS